MKDGRSLRQEHREHHHPVSGFATFRGGSGFSSVQPLTADGTAMVADEQDDRSDIAVYE